MPNISNRQRELEAIEFLILQHSIEEAMLLYFMTLSTRFIEHPRKDRSKTNLHFYFIEVFPHLSDAAFRSCFRTTKEGFKSLKHEDLDSSMSQSTRNAQFLRPKYGGETKTLPGQVQTNAYFNAIVNDLVALKNIKRLPGEITMFAHALHKHYEGQLGTEKVKLARVNARKKLGTLLLSSMESVSSKMTAEKELDLEIAGECSLQVEPCNPFLEPQPITTSRSALSPQKSIACHTIFPILSNASSYSSTSSTTAQESTAPAAAKSSRSSRKKLKMVNTMLSHVSNFFEESDEEEFLGVAKDHCLVAGFEDYACSPILVEYLPDLREKGVDYLQHMLIADRGKLASDHLDGPPCPRRPCCETKFFTSYSRCVIISPILHMGRSRHPKKPVFITGCTSFDSNKYATIQTGDKTLEASKVVRRQQAAEYGEISEAGRKVDCLFAFESIELSNVELKLRGASDKEIAIQNRKNIRLARALQEAHARHGAGDSSVFMADVAVVNGTVRNIVFSGFVGTFYQSKSLAIIGNYIARLEAQGPELVRAYDMHDRQQEINRHYESLSLGRPRTLPRLITTIRHNLVLSPSKRRKVPWCSE
ncbi:hypothetical protein BGZ96_008244 [Linnemannia gamsii]|uniref:Uncharacterized protein n=1 Tax=Linnemannia gamsii TaxID=64522 RepID=A0ABQ7KEI7_9FUNG|nr:hypothetical protein BGZ96_008244 [Linnemannia gamsii]